MNVLINGLAALKPRTGVGHHLTQLVQQLRQHPEHHFTLYPGERLAGWIRRFQQRGSGQPSQAPAAPSPWKFRFKELAKSAAKAASHVHFAAFSRAGNFDLYHEPNFIPYPSRLPTVITIHDLSVIRFPEWHPADRVKLHRRKLAEAAHQADAIITVSEAIRREICETWPVDSTKVVTIYNGIAPHFVPPSAEQVEQVRQSYRLPKRFFLCVGTIEPRKNLAMLMRAYGALPASLRESCPLVLAGPWGWKAEAERQAFAEVPGLIHLGYVVDADLPGLYGAATALLYPSHYEGFGMPPTEMLACGGAVIASDIPVLREVCSGRMRFIPPTDQTAWADALTQALEEPEAFFGSGSVPFDRERFTWSRAALQTLQVYQKVLNSRG